MIYLDNAATTLKKPDSVYKAINDALLNAGNASRGAHEASLYALRTVYDARKKIAELFNHPNPDHIIFTSNVTESLNTAINGIYEKGDRFVTTDLEHNSVLRPLYRLEAEGLISLDFVRADEKGNISYAELEEKVSQGTRAIVCTHASNLTGNTLDLYEIGRIAKKYDSLLIVDAAQTAGVLPIDMEAQGIDILCFTGHKALFGPQGTGGMALRDGVKLRPLKVGGSGVLSHLHEQPENLPEHLEAGTLNAHGIAGLNAGVQFILETGIEKIYEHEKRLTDLFYEELSNTDGVKIYGDFSANERAAVMALNIRDYDSSDIADRLFEEFDIAVRAGMHCAPRMHEALGTLKKGAVRFSFSYFNTEEEIREAIRAVKQLAEQ